MARRARLVGFLGKRFTDSKDLRAFVDDTFGLDAVHSIGWEEGVNDETSDLLRWLDAKGRMAELWPALREAFPNFTAEIDALAAEWKPGPLAKLVPGSLLRSRPFQVGAAAVVFGIATLVWFLWFRTASYTAIVVLDGAARDAVAKGETFTITVDDVPEPIGPSGVSIGRGELLPSSLESAYRKHVPAEFPRKIGVRLTKSRASKMRVFLGATECATQPQIIADDHSLRVVKLDHCDTRTASPIPKPMIGIAVSVTNSDGFRRQLQSALNKLTPPTTIEEFLTERLIDQFRRVEMFEFVAASASIPKERTLVARIETSWPSSGEVVMRLQLGAEKHQPPIRLLQAIGCATPAQCSIESLTAHETYDALFKAFFEAWPAGFMKSVPLTTTAVYEDGGGVRTVEDLAQFGQVKGGPPTAMFDIEYGNNRQRTFVLCHAQPRGAAGFDVAPDEAPLLCSKRTPTAEPGGKNGIVTLLKVLVVR